MAGGRPKGSTTRPQLRDQLTPQRITALVKKAEEMANNGDPIMLKFLLEQIYGKAPQPLEGNPEKPLLVKFDDSFTPSTKTHSKSS